MNVPHLQSSTFNRLDLILCAVGLLTVLISVDIMGSNTPTVWSNLCMVANMTTRISEKMCEGPSLAVF